MKDKSQLKRLEEVERLVSEFGPTNPSFIYSVMLPKFLRQRLGFDIVDRIHDFFDFFSKLYEQGGYSIGKLMAHLRRIVIILFRECLLQEIWQNICTRLSFVTKFSFINRD